jgi:DMSO/TMAO reductase YedYZ molybdopterin-dependent catalytic subunit
MRKLHAPVKAVLLAVVLTLCSTLGHAAPPQAAPESGTAQGTAPAATLKIEGAVPTPLTLTAADLAKLPRSTATLTSDGGTTTYEGVLLYDLLAKAGWQFGRGMTGKPMASYIVATARDGYQVLFAIAEIDPLFAGEKVLIADKADGATLPGREQPFRVVVPGDKMHARSIYSVVKLEVVRLRP